VKQGARQILPEDECLFLRGLAGTELRARVQELNTAGWSLAAIGNAFDPPRGRSTVRSWTVPPTQSLTHTRSIPSPSSSHSQNSLIAAAENSTPPKRERRVYTPSSPALLSAERDRIVMIAPLARRYRARANPNGVYASANDELTSIAHKAYSRGVAISELAAAADVTYRAMARRLGK
jgi:hypothetical protein